MLSAAAWAMTDTSAFHWAAASLFAPPSAPGSRAAASCVPVILHQQARPQLGIGWGSCRGFTVAEVERIDFGALDLSEFADDLMDGSKDPAVTLPDTGDTQTLMKDRVRDFYGRQP